MQSTIYVETSIIGYLTARSGDSLIFAGRQALTREWWTNRRHAYRLVSSPLTVEEIGRGDKSAAVERLGYLVGIELLDDRDTKIQAIAESLVTRAALPVKARSDALHVAIAAFHGVDYLMTWNCKHIANAHQIPKVYALLSDLGLDPPLIVTPDEFSDYE